MSALDAADWSVAATDDPAQYPTLKANPQRPAPEPVLASTTTPGTASTEISNWNQLTAISGNLDGNYTLVGNLNETTDGYETVVNTTNGFEPIGNGSTFTPGRSTALATPSRT